jgi:hypothetical protein
LLKTLKRSIQPTKRARIIMIQKVCLDPEVPLEAVWVVFLYIRVNRPEKSNQSHNSHWQRRSKDLVHTALKNLLNFPTLMSK